MNFYKVWFSHKLKMIEPLFLDEGVSMDRKCKKMHASFWLVFQVKGFETFTPEFQFFKLTWYEFWFLGFCHMKFYYLTRTALGFLDRCIPSFSLFSALQLHLRCDPNCGFVVQCFAITATSKTAWSCSFYINANYYLFFCLNSTEQNALFCAVLVLCTWQPAGCLKLSWVELIFCRNLGGCGVVDL